MCAIAEIKTIVYEGRVYDPVSDSGRIQIDGNYIEDDLRDYDGKRVKATLTIEVLE